MLRDHRVRRLATEFGCAWLHLHERDFRVNTSLVNCIGWRRYKKNGKGTYFSPKLIEMWGPAREGDEKPDREDDVEGWLRRFGDK